MNQNQETTRYICDASEAIFLKTAIGNTDDNIKHDHSFVTIGAVGDIGRFNDEYTNSIAHILDSCPNARFVLFSNSQESPCKERFSEIVGDRFQYFNSLDMNVFCEITDICFIPDFGMSSKLLEQVMSNNTVYAVFSLNYEPFISESAYSFSLRDSEMKISANGTYLKAIKYSFNLYNPPKKAFEDLFELLESKDAGNREKAENLWSVFRDIIYKNKLIELGFSEEEYSVFDNGFAELPMSQYIRESLLKLVQNKPYRDFMGSTQAQVHNNNISIRPTQAEFINIINGTEK